MFMQKVKICTTRNVQFPPGFEKRNRRGEEEESFSSQRTQCREQESHTHISLTPRLFSRQQIKIDSGVFGAQAPIMVPDKSVTMCQVCSTLFTFTFRRHHCRGCGKVRVPFVLLSGYFILLSLSPSHLLSSSSSSLPTSLLLPFLSSSLPSSLLYFSPSLSLSFPFFILSLSLLHLYFLPPSPYPAPLPPYPVPLPSSHWITL